MCGFYEQKEKSQNLYIYIFFEGVSYQNFVKKRLQYNIRVTHEKRLLNPFFVYLKIE